MRVTECTTSRHLHGRHINDDMPGQSCGGNGWWRLRGEDRGWWGLGGVGEDGGGGPRAQGRPCRRAHQATTILAPAGGASPCCDDNAAELHCCHHHCHHRHGCLFCSRCPVRSAPGRVAAPSAAPATAGRWPSPLPMRGMLPAGQEEQRRCRHGCSCLLPMPACRRGRPPSGPARGEWGLT